MLDEQLCKLVGLATRYGLLERGDSMASAVSWLRMASYTAARRCAATTTAASALPSTTRRRSISMSRGW